MAQGEENLNLIGMLTKLNTVGRQSYGPIRQNKAKRRDLYYGKWLNKSIQYACNFTNEGELSLMTWLGASRVSSVQWETTSTPRVRWLSHWGTMTKKPSYANDGKEAAEKNLQ